MVTMVSPRNMGRERGGTGWRGEAEAHPRVYTGCFYQERCRVVGVSLCIKGSETAPKATRLHANHHSAGLRAGQELLARITGQARDGE